MYRLDLFGGVALEGPDGPLSGRVMQRHPLALLSVLATSNSCTSARDRMIGLLWADQPEDRARHNLSDTIYVIHKSLGDATIQVRGDLLSLNCDLVSADVNEFDAALAAGCLEEAVERYRGAFLEGFHLSGSKAFEDWCDSKRRFYSFECGKALEQLARQAEARDDLSMAIEWWLRRARHSPYNSAIARICVQALLTNGDPGDAVHFAREHVQRLRDDLGVEPPADLVDVARGNPSFKAAPHEYDPPAEPNPGSHLPSPPGASVSTHAGRRPWVVAVAVLAGLLGWLLFFWW